MRKCPHCKTEKEESEFWKTCSYCKICQKKNWNERISKNKQKYACYRKDKWFDKKSRPCKKCGDQFIGKKRDYCSTKCCFNHQIIKQKNGCWEWTGMSSCGYGQLTIYETNKRMRAHRYSYSIYKGKVPDELHVCHHCDNPKCCAPSHLFLGTDKDNMADCKKKGRTAKGDKVAHRGESNKNSKFNNENIIDIRSMCSQGFKDRQIADKYKTSVQQINIIRHRKSWKHI